MNDQQAIDRYRYMLRTAPPDDIERAHAEAFASLTPEQRSVVLQQLSAQVPPSDVPASDDPQSLARMATRAEMRQPGTMERTFGGYGGPGMGGIFFATLAGAFVGTAVADVFFAEHGPSQDVAAADGSAGDGYGDTGSESGDMGGGGGDFGDFGGGDFGGF